MSAASWARAAAGGPGTSHSGTGDRRKCLFRDRSCETPQGLGLGLCLVGRQLVSYLFVNLPASESAGRCHSMEARSNRRASCARPAGIL
jgi:hypothetical protein